MKKNAILLPHLATTATRTHPIANYVLLSFSRPLLTETSVHHIIIPVSGIEDSAP
jgi:hypothetical protein